MLLGWRRSGTASVLSPYSLSLAWCWLLLKCRQRPNVCHPNFIATVPLGLGTYQKALTLGGHSAASAPGPTPCSCGLWGSGAGPSQSPSRFPYPNLCFSCPLEVGGGKEQIIKCSSRTGPWRAPGFPLSRCSSSGKPANLSF